MPFNENNYTQPPYTNGLMTLTHDECVYVLETIESIIPNYVAVNPWDGVEPDKTWIISNYNKVDNWKKAINGDTYDVLQGYDPLVNTLGINESGIIQEPIEETPSEVE